MSQQLDMGLTEKQTSKWPLLCIHKGQISILALDMRLSGAEWAYSSLVWVDMTNKHQSLLCQLQVNHTQFLPICFLFNSSNIFTSFLWPLPDHHELWWLFCKEMTCLTSYLWELWSMIHPHEEMTNRWRSLVCHWVHQCLFSQHFK